MDNGFKIEDLGMEALMANIAKIAQTRITIGWQGESGNAIHPDTDDVTVAALALIHEFGVGNIPARPALRHTFKEWGKTYDLETKRAISDLVDGRIKNAAEVIERLGPIGLEGLIETLNEARKWAAPLAPRTIKAKGHDRPLVESGHLRASASWAERHGEKIKKQIEFGDSLGSR